ncbi:MAG: HAD family hydrolase [Elusimicrobia bacterium]|nr:HAD family hydrolase [Elusimicrobiota bacterium]
MPEPRAIVLDFDGVILESNDAKTRAFELLFAAEGPEVVSRIVAHHRANGGISRFEKFRHAYREILKRPLSASGEEALGRRFNELVENAVAAAEWVPGARQFLEDRHASLPLFVASGTPQEELRRIVLRRGLGSYFRGVYGSPEKKDAILRAVAHEVGASCGGILMVGDAVNDYEAARRVGALFIGRVRPGEVNPFPGEILILSDLKDLSLAIANLPVPTRDGRVKAA